MLLPGCAEGASPSADDPTAELASHNHAGGWEQPDELSSIEIGSAADIYSNRSFLFGKHCMLVVNTLLTSASF